MGQGGLQETLQGALQGVFGLVVLLGLAWALSEKRSEISVRVVASAMALQVALALLLLRVSPVAELLSLLNKAVEALRQATLAGTSFVFGYLGGGPAPFEPTAPQNVFILATQGLPLILIVSALSALLFYWRILPLIVRGFACCWSGRSALAVPLASLPPPMCSSA